MENAAAVQVTPGKRQSSFVGAVVQRCHAIAAVANGGQIICDVATLEGIRSHMADLYKSCIGSGAKRALAQLAEYACLCLLPRWVQNLR